MKTINYILETINFILKTLVYLINSPGLFMDIVLIPYLLSVSLEDTVIDAPVIGLIILDVLYIYLIYLFYENTSLNKKNDCKIIIVVTVSIIISVIFYICTNEPTLTISFFLRFFLPYIIVLISIQFNKLCMKKLK